MWVQWWGWGMGTTRVWVSKCGGESEKEVSSRRSQLLQRNIPAIPQQMEHLDRENREETPSGYIVIGGKSSNLTRHPSLLQMSTESPSQHQHRERGPLKNGRRRSSEEGSLTSGGGGSRSGSSLGHSVVVRWDQEGILAWLREAGFDCYQVGSLS